MMGALAIFGFFLIPYAAYSFYVIKKMREMGSAADFTQKMGRIYIGVALVITIATLIWLFSSTIGTSTPLQEF